MTIRCRGFWDALTSVLTFSDLPHQQEGGVKRDALMGIRTDAIPDARVQERRFPRRSILLLDRHAYTPHGGRRCTAVNLVISAIANAWHKVNACGMQLFPRRQVDRSILISVPAATWTTRLFWRTVQPGEITCRRESGSEKIQVTLRIRPARFVRDSTQLLSIARSGYRRIYRGRKRG